MKIHLYFFTFECVCVCVRASRFILLDEVFQRCSTTGSICFEHAILNIVIDKIILER